jgi:glucosyl-dolichyl phosphate glucuronosyltransferase
LNNVAVVISVYSIDRANDVLDCIESVRKQTLPPKEIIVVLDPDEELVACYKKRLGSSVNLIISDSFGLSAARNIGIKESNSEFIAFIDDDAVAEPNWLENLVSNFDDSSVIGAGGLIIPVWPNENPSWFPEELYWIVGCSYKGLPTTKAVVRNPIGCNMIFRRRVFKNVGYFSTVVGRVGNKLMGHDDTEFGIRATRKVPGTKIIYDPEAVVRHRVSANRVSLKYVAKRSYAEGFSKAFVSHTTNGNSPLNTEKKYLQKLVLSSPQLLFQLCTEGGFSRFLVIWFSTFMVLLGYVAGSNKDYE